MPHFIMVVDDDETEIEIANQNRGFIQRFDFTFISSSASSSFTDPQLKFNSFKKDCKSSSGLIVLYLKILYNSIFRLSKWKKGETRQCEMNCKVSTYCDKNKF